MLATAAKRLARRGRTLQPLLLRQFQSSGDKLQQPDPVPVGAPCRPRAQFLSTPSMDNTKPRNVERSLRRSWSCNGHLARYIDSPVSYTDLTAPTKSKEEEWDVDERVKPTSTELLQRPHVE